MRLPGRHLFRQSSRIVKREFAATAAATHASAEAHRDHVSEAKSFDEMPALPSYPLLKAAVNYLPFIGLYDHNRFHHVGLLKYKQFGEIVREDHVFGLCVVSVFNPDDIETLFRHEGKHPFRGFLTSLRIYREHRKDVFQNKGLFVLQHEEWYALRSKVQKHMLRPKAVAAYLSAMDGVSVQLVANMKKLRQSNGEIDNFLNELYKWALESICLVGLDSRLGCLELNHPPGSEAQRLIQAIQVSFQGLADLEQSLLKLYRFVPTPKWKKFEKAQDQFTETAIKYVNKAMEKLKSRADEDHDMTFLETLLTTKDVGPHDAITMICDMIFAGVDTTAHASGFTMYHLAKNPEAQERAFQEVKQVLPSPDDPITSNKLQQLPYLKACVKESMRLSPVVVGTVRQLERDLVLGGYRIPAGVHVTTQNQVACRLEKYFPEPDQFRPERWLGRKDEEKPHPFASIPFSFGMRMCVGRRIAEQEIWTLMARVLRNFRMEYHHEDIDQITRTVNMPDKPLRIQFKDRS